MKFAAIVVSTLLFLYVSEIECGDKSKSSKLTKTRSTLKHNPNRAPAYRASTTRAIATLKGDGLVNGVVKFEQVVR